MTYETDNGDQIPARAMLHPAFLLRQPAHKRETWQDLMEVRVRLDASPNRSHNSLDLGWS